MAGGRKARRIGILTGGGDCPGLNAVIRAVAKPAILEHRVTVFGIEDGYEGLVEGKMRELRTTDLSGLINLGGTILGTSNKADPFHYPTLNHEAKTVIVDASRKALAQIKGWDLDAIVVIGGDGSMHIGKQLMDLGVNIVGVPKTIDNDLMGTDLTFGFDSAVWVATEAIDRLHTTASAHHRVMVIEVMGRYAGWIALHAGLAGGADIVLIPEMPFDWDVVFEKVIERSTQGKRFSIVCVAEGAHAKGEEMVVKAHDEIRTDPIQLGGIGKHVERRITEATGQETRTTVLGHLQRGGSPTPFDRVLATRFGAKACELAANGDYGMMAALKGNEIVAVPIETAIAKQRRVPPECETVMAARAVGTSFGVR
jgi:6-phosphofructokinase 1